MKKKFSQKIKIGKKVISKISPAFIIAEIGSNHNQSIKLAKKMIDLAAAAGVDAVKFQSLKFDQLYLKEPANEEIEKIHQKIDLADGVYKELFDYARRKNVIFLSCATYFGSLKTLEDLGVVAHKIASPITVGFISLVRAMALTKKPLIVSSGYCTIPELDRAMNAIKKTGNDNVILLHCTSAYPTLPQDANIKFLQFLQKRYNCLVGFSDHTMSVSIPATAVALGARIIEKHFTLSRAMEGPDHKFALEPDELKQLVKNIRDTEQSLGNGKSKKILPVENKFKKKIMMKIVAGEDVAVGTILMDKHLIFRRASGGVEEYKKEQMLGKIVKRPIQAMSLILNSYFK